MFALPSIVLTICAIYIRPQELSKTLEHAVIVAIICDRGDRYLSTGVFSHQGA